MTLTLFPVQGRTFTNTSDHYRVHNKKYSFILLNIYIVILYYFIPESSLCRNYIKKKNDNILLYYVSIHNTSYFTPIVRNKL